ncbi:ASKHA domain-containing protein [Hellea balneolensis]|uniref:ASKHA domain-containing protein n=1 Tax=Hellea balneolensis TaxID=287478 RepID=UPI00041BD86E|nr:ASKHA domain-containing protein [Hellea balneolensis]
MTTHTLIFTPSGITATAEDGETVYEVGLKRGIDIQSICGGKGLCKRCQIEIDTGKHAKFKMDVAESHYSKLSPTEKKAIHDRELPEGRRLSCRTKIYGDLVVNIPADSQERETSIEKKSTKFETELNPSVRLYMVKLPEPTLEENPVDSEALVNTLRNEHGLNLHPSHKMVVKLQEILRRHERNVIVVVRAGKTIIDVWPPMAGDLYGGAIDIGSTSIALYVFNLTTGELAYEKAAMNPQIRFGEDLMSRVSYIMMNKGGDERLTETIRTQIREMLAGAVEALDIKLDQFLDLICVGNPIMHHLFIGANPVNLGVAPFTLAVKDWIDIPANELGLGLSDAAQVSLFPLIGGHVGADTSAAYLTQIERMKDRSVLLVDIGTNAEIVLSHNGKVAAASSPTGPALEGAEISSGVRATLGAIERVRIDPVTKDAKVKIIGHDDWIADSDGSLEGRNVVGICGSGIFEVMVEMANAGLLDQSGLFKPEAAPHRFSQEGNVWTYLLLDQPGNPIIVKQTDIRAVQLAKAALFAGAQLLAETLDCQHFDEVLLAGAFGTHLDSKYVAEIGIVPMASAEIISSVGNAAGMGAAMALLNVKDREAIIAAIKDVEKIETALEPKFQDYFVSAMKFPTASAPTGGKTRGRRRAR